MQSDSDMPWTSASGLVYMYAVLVSFPDVGAHLGSGNETNTVYMCPLYN